MQSYVCGKMEYVGSKIVKGARTQFGNLRQDTEYQFSVQAKRDSDTLTASSNVQKTQISKKNVLI